MREIESDKGDTIALKEIALEGGEFSKDTELLCRSRVKEKRRANAAQNISFSTCSCGHLTSRQVRSKHLTSGCRPLQKKQSKQDKTRQNQQSH